MPAVVLAAAALFLAAGPAAAQGPPTQVTIPAGGTELFQHLLDRAKIRPVKRDELGVPTGERYDDVIVIILGNPHGSRGQGLDALGAAGQAARGGGAVLIASDTPLDPERWFGIGRGFDPADRGTRIDGERVVNPFPDHTHLGFPDCPYVVPVAPANWVQDRPADPGPIWDVFKGLDRVATNSPSFLRMSPRGSVFRYPLARFPDGSQTVRRDDFGREVGAVILPHNTPFAAGADGIDAGRSRASRLLLFADHSVFINQMLLEPGTDNLELAYRTIEFLQGPQKRSRCVFFENGRLVERFDQLRQQFAPPPMPFPPINLERMQEQLVDFGNAVADRLQANDVQSLPFRGEAGTRRYRDVLLGLMVVVATCAAVFLLRKVWKARKPTDVPPPPAVPGAPTGPPGVFDRRQKELLRRNNVYEPVRDLVREFFASVGVRGDPGPKVPGVRVSRAVRKAASLREAIRDFWRLAFGPPQAVTVSRWRELEPYFERVRKAHADGKWQFVTADELEMA